MRRISPSRRKITRSSAPAGRRTSTPILRTADGRVDGWHLRWIECSTVINGPEVAPIAGPRGPPRPCRNWPR